MRQPECCTGYRAIILETHVEHGPPANFSVFRHPAPWNLESWNSTPAHVLHRVGNQVFRISEFQFFSLPPGTPTHSQSPQSGFLRTNAILRIDADSCSFGPES